MPQYCHANWIFFKAKVSSVIDFIIKLSFINIQLCHLKLLWWYVSIFWFELKPYFKFSLEVKYTQAFFKCLLLGVNNQLFHFSEYLLLGQKLYFPFTNQFLKINFFKLIACKYVYFYIAPLWFHGFFPGIRFILN